MAEKDREHIQLLFSLLLRRPREVFITQDASTYIFAIDKEHGGGTLTLSREYISFSDAHGTAFTLWSYQKDVIFHTVFVLLRQLHALGCTSVPRIDSLVDSLVSIHGSPSEVLLDPWSMALAHSYGLLGKCGEQLVDDIDEESGLVRREWRLGVNKYVILGDCETANGYTFVGEACDLLKRVRMAHK